MIKRLLVLALVASVAVAIDDDQSFLVALLPDPIYKEANTQWPVPLEDNVNHLKVTVTNVGSSSDDVGFHTYLPDYTEMTSFTMHTDGVAYSGRKVSHQVAQNALSNAKDGDHVTAVHVPKRIPAYADNQIQNAETTIHIKGETRMTIDVGYEEANPSNIVNKTQVVLHLYGSSVSNVVGEVSSPNYPNTYPDNADVSWLIRVPDGKTVRLDIVDLDIEECCDRLTIYDGNSFTGSIIASVSGNLHSQNNLTTYLSTGSSMSLHLTSDYSVTNSGFRAVTSVGSNEIHTTEAPIDETTAATINACSNGEYLDLYYSYSYGYIYSPNYPSYYYNNMQCYWTIHSHNGYYIKATVQDLALADDYLTFYDGYSSYDPILAQYTGYDYPSPVYSTGYYMYIRFQTNQYNTNRGFQVKYEASTVSSVIPACAGGDYLYVNPYNYVNITSPEYPGYYSNNLNCTWQVYSSYYGYVIELTVSDFSLNSGDDVSIYDGDSGYLLARFTSYNYFSPVYSTSSHMTIVFTTDSNYVSRGFEFLLTGAHSSTGATTDNPSGSGDEQTTAASSLYCDDWYSLRSGFGNITSPFYPSYYYNDMQCSYSIQTNYPYYIKLTVVDLALSSYDYLTVYDGYSEYYNVLASYTGYWSNVNVSSSGQSMFLKFQSDSYYTNRGFDLKYETIATCDITYYPYSSYGTINSTNYGYGNYPSNLRECWVFPQYYDHIHLTFNSMNTESYWDQLTLYSYDNYVKRWEGYYPDGYYESVYTDDCYYNCALWMAFVSDEIINYSGFSITYSLH